jgi:uncharacterized protein (TIGR02271 family)
MNENIDRQVIAAHFSNTESASEAIRQLRAAGFRNDQIGTSFEGGELEGRTYDATRYGTDYETHHRSFMEKMKDFFTGEEGYEDRDTGSGDGARQEGMRVDRTLTIPDRYNDRLTNGGNIITVHASDRIDEAERILSSCGGTIDREFVGSDFDRSGNLQSEYSNNNVRADLGSSDIDRDNLRTDVRDEGRRISLLSEVLRVNKERVETGEVRLRKDVRTENQTINVPVSREELVIERVAGNNRNATGEQIGDNDEIRVPLSEERVNVEKAPVVREEVRVGKRQVQDTQTVSDNVRHEELEVDDKTGRVRDTGDVVKGKNKKIA